MKTPKHILPVIVIAQFCCTSLWFAGNGVMEDLVLNFGLKEGSLGHLTSAVQFGFISGTLIFALLTIADRFSPSKVFFFSAVLGAVFNLGTVLANNTLITLLVFRFLTGFFLAGIYPVGMKIAADYFEKGLGKSLGFLVGALVLGTAFPHFLNGFGAILDWKTVIFTTSFLAILGGLSMLLFVPNGPFRKQSQQLDFSVLFKVFRDKNFRSPAFGYFGHMWELYTFWAFLPVMISSYNMINPTANLNVSLYSFLIIASGSLACVIGRYLAERLGTKKVAFYALLLSSLCCLVSPLLFSVDSTYLFVGFLLFWGMVVIADSPLFSTLVAQSAIAENKGTALTIVNCIGFAITIVSIQVIGNLQFSVGSTYIFMLLAVGPILGLIALRSHD
jgi:MFS family permease